MHINQKFILCKKTQQESWKAFEKTLCDSQEECFNKVVGKLNIKDNDFSKFTYEKYLQQNKELLEDITVEKLLKFDCISKDFFEIYDLYRYIDEAGEEDFLVFDKGELDYNEILKALTKNNFEINRVEKVINNLDKYSISMEDLKDLHNSKEGIREKIMLIKYGPKKPFEKPLNKSKKNKTHEK